MTLKQYNDYRKRKAAKSKVKPDKSKKETK